MIADSLVPEFRALVARKFCWALFLLSLAVMLIACSLYSTVPDDRDDVGAALGRGFAAAGIGLAVAWGVLLAGIFGAIGVGRARVPRAKLIATAFLPAVLGAVVGFAGLLCVVLVDDVAPVVDGRLVARFVVGLAAVTCWSLIGAGLGMMFGSAFRATLVLVAWCCAVEGGMAFAFADRDLDWLRRPLPCATTTAILLLDGSTSSFLTAWPIGLLMLVGWTSAVVGAGWWCTRRRAVATKACR